MPDTDRHRLQAQLEDAIRSAVPVPSGLWQARRIYRNQCRWAARSLTLHLEELLASVHPQCVVLHPSTRLWEGWIAHPLPQSMAQWRFLTASRIAHLQWDNHQEQWAVQPLWSVRLNCSGPQITATVYTPHIIQTIYWSASDHMWCENPHVLWDGAVIDTALEQAVTSEWLDPSFVLDWRQGRSRAWRFAAFFVSRSFVLLFLVRGLFQHAI